MTRNLSIKFLPNQSSLPQNRIYKEQLIKNNDLIIQKPFENQYPFIFSLLQISIISESKRPISLINLPFINPVWWESIKERRNFLSLASNRFYIIFSSRFNKEMGLQLQINLYLDLVFLIMMT